MRRLAPLLGAVAVVALAAACTQSPEQVSGAAGPVGTTTSAPATTTTTPSAPATTGAASSAPTAGSKPSNRPSTDLEHLIINPTHVGQLRVGMSLNAAKATGLIGFKPGAIATDPTGCSYATWIGHADDNGIIFNGRYGIRAIQGVAQQHTPEGIRIGSTLSAAKKAFPDFRFRADGGQADPDQQTGAAFADPNPGDGAHYRFAVKNGKVTEVGLESDRTGCYE